MARFKSLQELFADPSRWGKRHYAVNVNELVVAIDEESACRWCLVGACHAVYPDPKERQAVYLKLDEQLFEKLQAGYTFTSWNDAPERTHAEVLELVTKANV